MNIYPTAVIAAVPGSVEAAAARPGRTAAAGAAPPAVRPSVADQADAPANSPAGQTAAPVDPRDLKKSVEAINRQLKDNSEVQFSIDETSGYSVVKVIDTESKKVLRQFPSQQALDIGRDLRGLKGMLVDNQA